MGVLAQSFCQFIFTRWSLGCLTWHLSTELQFCNKIIFEMSHVLAKCLYPFTVAWALHEEMVSQLENPLQGSISFIHRFPEVFLQWFLLKFLFPFSLGYLCLVIIGKFFFFLFFPPWKFYIVALIALNSTSVVAGISIALLRMQEAGDSKDFELLPLPEISSPDFFPESLSYVANCLLVPMFLCAGPLKPKI